MSDRPAQSVRNPIFGDGPTHRVGDLVKSLAVLLQDPIVMAAGGIAGPIVEYPSIEGRLTPEGLDGPGGGMLEPQMGEGRHGLGPHMDGQAGVLRCLAP